MLYGAVFWYNFVLQKYEKHPRSTFTPLSILLNERKNHFY